MPIDFLAERDDISTLAKAQRKRQGRRTIVPSHGLRRISVAAVDIRDGTLDVGERAAGDRDVLAVVDAEIIDFLIHG